MENGVPACAFPPETLQQIFQLLPTRQLLRCREVCLWWKAIIDELLRTDKFWRERCSTDFRNVHKEARSKSSPSLSWRDLYVSLSLWPKFMMAKENWSEISLNNNITYDLTSELGTHIPALHAWKGNVAAHEIDSIVYYDSQTLEQTNKIDIDGEYMTFDENDDVVVYLYYTHQQQPWIRQLRIVPKHKQMVLFDKMVRHDQVNHFVIFQNKIFYNTWHYNDSKVITEMHLCDLKELKSCLLCRLSESVCVFGCDERSLNYLSMNEELYSLVDDSFILTDNNVQRQNCFAKLCRYSLTKGANFTGYIRNISSIRASNPYLAEAMHVYGEMAFLGSTDGVLKIYNRADLFADRNTKPLKEYDLKPSFNLFRNPQIGTIDVLEKKNGHIIMLSMATKIMLLNLSHK